MKRSILIGALLICSGQLYANGVGVAIKSDTDLAEFPKSATANLMAEQIKEAVRQAEEQGAKRTVN